MVKLQMLRMEMNLRIENLNSKRHKNASKKSFVRILVWIFVCISFPFILPLIFAFFCSFVLFVGLVLCSVFPFWMYSFILTCFLIFSEFETKNLFKKCNTGCDDTKNGKEILEKKDVKSLEFYQKTKIWSTFESRKGFWVFSYVGFFGGFGNFPFFDP